MANNLFWKCGDGEWNTSTGIGRTVLAIVTDYIDYIKQDLDKDFDALSSELFLSGGNTQKLIDDLEKVTIKNRKHFYCKEGEIIHFRDKKIVVNNEFGRTGQSKERWENFIKLISGLGSGYMIGDGGFTDKVKSEHVIKAFKHIGEKGNKDKNGIQYVFNPSLYMGVSSKGHDNWFAINEAMRVAYLYATGEQPSEEDEKFTEEQIIRDGDMFGNSRWVEKRFKELGFEVKRFKKGEKPMPKDENKIVEETLKVLKQFKQIILFGPPGTGKTFGAKKLLKELFRVKTDEKFKAMQKDIPSGETLVENGLPMYERNRWDIVQFHPSYNYEDFVRGINVFTENHMVKYTAQDRIFVDMCGQAQRDPDREYALIIDEINRANVSAVLGELIYALEYRGAKIQIPYSGTLIIPKNLYIIGTMNTADRTIGQIDYAVRRRFAFVHCPPKESVITDERARVFFDDVDNVFKHTSPDFDKEDVRIGHSYFLASGHELANKIIYQVVPILREYVKDGVLTSGAKELINEIEESAKKF